MKSERGLSIAGKVAGVTEKNERACNDIIARLKRISNTNSDTSLAKALGLKQSSISTAKARNMVPAAWIIHAINLYNVSVDWLLFGLEQKNTPQKISKEHYIDHETKVNDDEGDLLNDPLSRFERLSKLVRDKSFYQIKNNEYAYIPLVSNTLSKDGGSFTKEESPEIIDYLAFKKNWLLKLGRPKNFRVMAVQDDSMFPTLHDNDVVLFDIHRTKFRPGAVYAISFNNYIMLRRVHTAPGETIYKADNNIHPEIRIDSAKNYGIQPVHLIGQVIWWCHQEKI